MIVCSFVVCASDFVKISNFKKVFRKAPACVKDACLEDCFKNVNENSLIIHALPTTGTAM